MARRPYTGRMTSAYGPRVAPMPGASSWHRGEDGVGGVIVAPERGRGIQYSYMGAFGNLLQFKGDSGTVHYFAHIAPGGLRVPVNTIVAEGVALATMGQTGTATGVHVHWETRRPHNDIAFNPAVWLTEQGGTAGGGSTPLVPYIESDDMLFFGYTSDSGGPLWSLIDANKGKIVQTRKQSEANDLARIVGKGAQTWSVQDLLNAINLAERLVGKKLVSA